MTYSRLTFIIFAIAFFAGCTQTKEQPLGEVIDGALANAEQQALLMAAKLADDDGKLPGAFLNGQFTTINSGSWVSGFFPGLLWYLYEYDPKRELLDYARLYTARIEPEKNNTSTHDLGFMLYCSFGNGYRITGDTAYRNIMLTGAASLSTRYREHLGVIQSWGKSAKWQYPVIIDNMMNLEFLFWAARASGDKRFRDICISHADRTIKEHFRPDYSTYHVVSFDTITGLPHAKQTAQGYADESSWARGQAWGLYGFTMMYRETQDPAYLEQAKNIAGFLLHHPNMPADYVPYWDFNAPDIPDTYREASAGAIICSALIELSGYVDAELSKEYLKVAEIQLRTLASPAFTAKTGENGDFILMHSNGSVPGNSDVDTPLAYADYYFVEALLRYRKLLEK
ncbi:MAG: glycoside hydrolase family 88 protein [Tannerella sp.]|jgi:rhamnogalacturonyl hydrolase YesR|nr:glycoside hydrolase family 88 protein [Tannerella sp.]